MLGGCTKRWNEVIVNCDMKTTSVFVHPAKRSKPLSIQHLRLVSDKADCIVISASSCQCTVWSAKAVRRSLCHDCVVCAVGPSPAAIAVFPFLEIWSFGELPNCRNSQYSDFYRYSSLETQIREDVNVWDSLWNNKIQPEYWNMLLSLLKYAVEKLNW